MARYNKHGYITCIHLLYGGADNGSFIELVGQ